MGSNEYLKLISEDRDFQLSMCCYLFKIIMAYFFYGHLTILFLFRLSDIWVTPQQHAASLMVLFLFVPSYFVLFSSYFINKL
jgi:hypothetical protein